MELTGNVQGLIDLVGGGSDVEYEQILESGEKIGVITIDNVPTDIYAPDGAEVEVTQVLSSGVKIATIEVDGEGVDLYAPTPEEPTSVEVTQVLSSGTKIATIEVNNNNTDLYAPSAVPDYSTRPVKTGRKWIDNCDVWEAVFVFNLTSTAQTIDLSNFHIKDLISVRGTINGSETSTNGYQMPFPFYLDNTYFAMFTKNADSNALVETSNYMIEAYNIVECIIEFTTT